MNSVDWFTRCIAIAGFGISLVLAIIKFLEYSRTKVSLKSTYIWRGSAEIGNSVLIMNESTLPVCIYNYEIVAKKVNSVVCLVDNEDSFSVIKIEALSAYELTFLENNHFSLSGKQGTVFIKLWIVGRRNPV